MGFFGVIVGCSSKLTQFSGETLEKVFHLLLFLLISMTEITYHGFSKP
jgi:hypothetical protein